MYLGETMKIIFLLHICLELQSQVLFAPKQEPIKRKHEQEILERFYREDPLGAKAKRHEFKMWIDDKIGRAQCHWIDDNGKPKNFVLYFQDRLNGSIECKIIGDTLPFEFCYQFAFKSPCIENFISWRIASLCNDSNRFYTLTTIKNRIIIENQFRIHADDGITGNKSMYKGYPGFYSGVAQRSARTPLNNFHFNLTYRSYCLPRVVPCEMESSRPETYKNKWVAGDSDNCPDYVDEWFNVFMGKHGLTFKSPSPNTLGPGLDAEKATSGQMIDELLYNIQTAKDDNWIPWSEGGEPLLASLREIKTLLAGQKKQELVLKLREATQRLEPLKGKGRSEFYPMVKTYLVFLQKKASA